MDVSDMSLRSKLRHYCSHLLSVLSLSLGHPFIVEVVKDNCRQPGIPIGEGVGRGCGEGGGVPDIPS